jgi:hypothetical protein
LLSSRAEGLRRTIMAHPTMPPSAPARPRRPRSR